MARTNVKGTQVLDGSVGRVDLNTTTSGNAVITRLIAGNGFAITNDTGADSGTGDVTVAADLAFLDTKYPSITASRTQNYVLAAPAAGSGTAAFRALVAGDIPAIGISGITGLQTSLDNKWTLGGNSLSNTGVLGSTNDQNIQLIRNSVVGLTLKADGITEVKKLAVGRISGQSGTSWDSLAVFGGNVTIGGRDSATQGSYDLNLVAHTTNDNPGNASRKSRIKFGYFDATNLVDKFKRTIEYWRATDALVIGSHSTLITDTATTAPIEGNSIYFGSDGSVGIGSSGLAASSLKISKIITGDGQDSGYGILNNGIIQPDISVTAYYNNTFASTAASASVYNIPGLIHYSARQLSFGNNSSVSNQYAFYADATLISATNNYGFYGAIVASTGDWNVYMAGSANNYFSGNVWIGTNAGAYKLDVIGTGHFSQNVTFDANAILSTAPTSGNHLVNKTYADTKLSGTGTTNYVSKYTASGTLGNSSIFDNAQGVGIGSSVPGISTLKVSKDISTSGLGGGLAIGIRSDGQVANDVNATAYYFRSDASTAAAVTNVMHYSANQGIFGGTVGTQTGFYADAFTGGSANIGFRGNLAAATNNWNLYMSGTANNYLLGNLGIGTAAPTTRLSFGSFWNSSAETVGINLREGSIAGTLPAYGIGFGPSSTEGYINYRSGTSSSALYGHKWFVNDLEVMRINGLGSLGVGTINLSGYNARIIRDFNTGTGYGVSSEGLASTDSSTITNFNSVIGTGVDANPSTIRHYYAQQSSNWQGLATTVIGFGVSSSLTASTNTYAFRSDLTAGSGQWNIFMIGTAPNYMAGSLGIGASSLSNVNLGVAKNITGGTTSMGIWSTGQIQSDVTGAAYYYRSGSNVQDATFTLTDLYHYGALQANFVTSATLTRQTGFFVGNLTAAQTNIAVRTQVASAVNSWNIYADGTANNHFAGKIGIGTTTLSSANIMITLPITGSGTYYGIQNSGIVQPDVSTLAVYFRTNAITAASTSSYTISNLVHFGAYRGTLGSNSNVTNQVGFFVDSSLVGAVTSNIAYYSGIGAGITNWGFYSAGSANNYFNGNVWIGTTTGSYKLDVNGTARFSGATQFDAIPSCAAVATSGSHLVNLTTLLQYASGIRYDQNKVKTVAMSNISLSGHQTIAGVTTSGSDRVLVMGQTDQTKNGIYLSSSSTWVRDSNFNVDSEMRGAIHTVELGTYAGYKFVNTNNSAMTVDGAGASNITYTEFSNLVETDPVFTAHAAFGVTSGRIANWDNAYTLISGFTTTNNLNEGTNNLYFTTTRVLATALTGYSVGTNAALAATDSILQGFQKVQGQLNNRLALGGNSVSSAITVGTNDNFDFSLERNNTTHLSLQSGVSKFFFDIDVVGKVKLNGNTGSDHQFIKFNGTVNEWATLNTGELSDKNDIALFKDYGGERGFQLYSDSTNAYANALVFSNQDAGIALALHGFSVDSSDTIKEFGLQLDTDGLLYHKKLDGSRKQIATVDMISGGGGSNSWSGGAISGDIYVPFGKSIWWDFENTGSFITMYEAGQLPISSAKTMLINSNNHLSLIASQTLKIGAQKILFYSTNSAPVEVDFSNANSFSDGHYLRFQKSTSGGLTKLTIISA
ncbi:beta strand repeat-containing protein [Emticicia fontis]